MVASGASTAASSRSRLSYCSWCECHNCNNDQEHGVKDVVLWGIDWILFLTKIVRNYDPCSGRSTAKWCRLSPVNWSKSVFGPAVNYHYCTRSTAFLLFTWVSFFTSFFILRPIIRIYNRESRDKIFSLRLIRLCGVTIHVAGWRLRWLLSDVRRHRRTLCSRSTISYWSFRCVLVRLT